MNFINVFISEGYRVSIQNNNLLIEGEVNETRPLEDIGVVLLENHKCSITVRALSKLTEYGSTVFVCDERHLPSAVLLPSNSYYKPLFNYNLQVSIAKPRLKNLWKRIIEKKIYNQAQCLIKNGIDAGKLTELAQSVFSGDSDNKEAQASAFYFPKLFGKNFTRDNDCLINSCLNYAYAIVRGVIARHICARGFLPCLGVFHCNSFNPFNLADDLIEPFRPIVDYFVYNNVDDLGTSFGPHSKKLLFSILNLEVYSDNEKHSLSYAVEREVESIIGYYSGNDKILFPSICSKEQKVYE